MPGIPKVLRVQKPDYAPLGTSPVARALRRRRRKLGLSRAAAAGRMDTNEETLRKWEAGHTPSVSRIPKVITFLGEEPWPAPTTFAERLRLARWRRGLTIEEAATALGVVPSTVWWWEQGRKPHRRDDRRRIEDFAGAEPTQQRAALTACSEELSTRYSLADALRHRRRELSLTQQAAAASIEVNTWTYLGWEQGRRIPPDRYFPALIRFLDHEPWPEPRTQWERLRAERLRRGLTRDQLAAVLMVDPASITAWENGDGPRHQLAKDKVTAFLEGRARPIRAKRVKQGARGTPMGQCL